MSILNKDGRLSDDDVQLLQRLLVVDKTHGSPIPFPTLSVQQTSFQSGHGFVAVAPSTGTQADDAATFQRGSQALRLTTTAAVGSQVARKTGMTALDATGKMLVLEVMVDYPERLTSLRLDVSSDVFTNWSSADVISPTTNVSTPLFVSGEWVRLTLPWGAFAVGGGAGATRSALTGFQVRCTTDGTGPIQMWVNLIASTPEPANGIITFTFDDGYVDQYTNAKPILDAAGYRACFGPIINKIGTSNNMTVGQLTSLRDAGWEPLVHAYDIAIHNAYATSTDDEVISDLLKAKAWMIDNGFGPANNFLIPQGGVTSRARSEAYRKFFQLTRTSYTRSRESYPPAKRQGLRAYTLSSGHTLSDVEAKVDEANTNKEWLIIEAHQIVASGAADAISWTVSDFQSLVTYIVGTGMKVKTFAEVLQTGVA